MVLRSYTYHRLRKEGERVALAHPPSCQLHPDCAVMAVVVTEGVDVPDGLYTVELAEGELHYTETKEGAEVPPTRTELIHELGEELARTERGGLTVAEVAIDFLIEHDYIEVSF